MSDGRSSGPRAVAATRARSDPHPSGDDRFEALDKAIRRSRGAQDQLIELLHVAQDLFGYLSEDLLVYLARALRMPHSRVYGVATFYHLFTFEQPGAHTCTVCTGTACFVKGADGIVRAVSEAYGVAPGGTTADAQLTLSTARCIGSCGLAPVVVLDGQVRAYDEAGKLLETLREAVGQGGVAR